MNELLTMNGKSNGTENAVAIIKDSDLTVIKGASDTLILNEATISKAVSSCEKILARIEKDGMNEELDDLCNRALVRLKEVHTEAMANRSPLTKIFDEIRTKFTTLETKIDSAKKDSVYGRIQAKRNAFATVQKEKQREKEEAAANKLKGENEKITLKAEAEIQMRNGFLRDLDSAKQLLQDVFNETTLLNYKEHHEKIVKWDDTYHKNEFNALQVSLRALYLTPADVETITLNACAGKFALWTAEYKDSIRNMKQDLMDKMPGKKLELEAMANANATEKKRLQKIADQRKIAEDEKALQESKDLLLKSTQEIEAAKQVELTNSLFDNTVELSFVSQANVAENYEIIVHHPSGYMLLFQLWFQREGIRCTNEEIEKKTVKQMVAFCAKLYKDTKEKPDSPYIEYKPVYKVRAQK